MNFSPALHRRLALLLAAASAAMLAACEPPAPDTPDAPAPVSTQVTEAAPQNAGFTRSGLDALDARLQALVDAGDRSGVVAVLSRNGEVGHVSEAGYADVAAQTPMTADTLVRIASMSKPVTAVAAMMLIEDGALSLDTPVSDYIPAFANARVATSTSVDESYEIPTEPLQREITV